ncbi:MAG: LytR/AlgR family response regulator transcription factor [Chitinophagales bacterium]
MDDEPIAQQIIEQYILKIEALEFVGKSSNALEVLNVLQREQVDIMFLDIKMPSLSGLEMLKTIQNPPKVILTTAFSEFGVESYEYGITDYLLKPISFERFLKAVNKIILPKNAIVNKDSSVEKPAESTFLFFKADKKFYKYYLADILFIEGSGNYVKIHSKHDKPLMVLDKLTDLQNKLPPNLFIRIHKSFIVNISHIQKIEGNILTISFKSIPISLTFKQSVEEIININS